MIRVVLNRNKGLITSVTVTGHAGKKAPDGILKKIFKSPPEYGNILCASVSVLCYMLANALERVEGLNIVVEEKPGFFKVSLKNFKDTKKAEGYFLTFVITINDLKVNYPQKIQVVEEDENVT